MQGCFDLGSFDLVWGGKAQPCNRLNQIKVLGGGGVGEETLLQKGPSPTKRFNAKHPELKMLCV